MTERKVSTLLHREFGDVTIEDLPLPYFCVSSNLATGHSDVHRQGTLWRRLRASVAIPDVLPPVVNNGEVRVDGGTMNNLPVDAMRELGRGPATLAQMDMLNWQQFDRAVALGYEHTARRSAELPSEATVWSLLMGDLDADGTRMARQIP